MAVEVNYEYSIKDTAVFKIVLDNNYIVQMSDQRAYQFIREDFTRFDKLIHEEEVDRFYTYFDEQRADFNPSRFIILHIRRDDGTNRECMLTITDIDRIIDGASCIELEIRDLVSLYHRYDKATLDVRKYRIYMGMIPEYFFDYDPATEDFAVFYYRGFRSENVYKMSLNEFYKMCIDSGYVEGKEADSLKELFNKIRGCAENFAVQIKTSLLQSGKQSEQLQFFGQSMYYNNRLVRVVGIISQAARLSRATGETHIGRDAVDNDPATGLLNKRAITEFVKNRIHVYNQSYGGSKRRTFYLVICDIDYFKSVNDTYGHLFGDEVIYKFAQTLRRWVGEKGIVGRIGGDEFMAILDAVDDEVELRSILANIKGDMEWAFQNKAPDYRFTTSMGVSKYPNDATEYERLFRIADKALYIAKEKGRDRYIIYRRELHGELEEMDDERIVAHTAVAMKPLAKADLAANLILLLSKNGRQMIPYVLGELVEHFNIHGIAVYVKDDENKLKQQWVAGKYEVPADNAPEFMTPNYFDMFNENGINVIHNVKEFEVYCPEMYKFWMQHNICSTLQYLIGSRQQVYAVISLDIFGENRRKWSDNDVEILYLIMKFMGDVLEL